MHFPSPSASHGYSRRPHAWQKVPEGVRQEYITNLIEAGFTTPEALQTLDKDSLERVGIKTFAHVKLILKALQQMSSSVVLPTVSVSEIKKDTVPVALRELLNRAGIPQDYQQTYGEALVREGFTSEQAFKHIDPQILASCGITAQAHVRMILAACDQAGTPKAWTSKQVVTAKSSKYFAAQSPNHLVAHTPEQPAGYPAERARPTSLHGRLREFMQSPRNANGQVNIAEAIYKIRVLMRLAAFGAHHGGGF